MSSSFSRFSPPATAMIAFPFVGPVRPSAEKGRSLSLPKDHATNAPAGDSALIYAIFYCRDRPSRRCEQLRQTANYRRKTMAKAGQSGLDAIVTALPREARKGPPPVHLWNPPFCGDIDMRIAADGTWFYQKSPIGRHALVKLFASVLKREGDRHYLVTPVEKVGITVDDAPFM